MKIVKNIIRLCAAALAVLPIIGCSEEEYVKPSALLSESSLTFEAIGAEPQSLTIASDEAWFIDVDADWITVDPTSGTNTVDVTVSVTDNVANGAMAAPREGTLTIANNRGYSIRTVIYQKGDTYLGVAESTVTEAAAFEDGTVAKIRDAQVMAVAKTGFVIGDGQTNMYVEGERSVTAGDIVQLSGKCAVKGGVPAFVVDGLEVGQNAELRPAEPVVVDGTSTSYPFDKVTYAKVSGTIIGNLLRLSGGVNCKIIDPVESVGATELNVHKVEALCYYVGTFDKQYAFVIFSLKDNGVDDTVGKPLPYSDDFSWLAPYIELANSKLPEASKISDCVGAVTSSADGCANIYTTLKDNGCDVLGELRSRGYTDLNPGFKTIYLQDAYFKFGKTNCQSGLTLPLFKIDGEQDIVVSFRWCSQMQGSGKIDETHMVVAIDGPGTVVTAKGTDGAKISDPLAHSQKQGQMMWQDAMFTIKGATTATAITIRSNEFGSPDDVVKDVFRYYLDDIEVMLAADAVTADIKVEGIENDLITFEGTPAAPVKFNVTSSAAFKVSSSANWLHVENGEGGAGQTNEVTVTCDQSELSVLRKAEITVKSGVSTKKIQVVQSAAGQSLDPFISVTSGNYVTVGSEETVLTINLQANVDYDYVASYDYETEEWITFEPKTKALVEKSEVVVKIAQNKSPNPRIGEIRFFSTEFNIFSTVIVHQDAYTAGLGYLPVIWHLGDNINFSKTFPENGKIMPVENDGYIQYVPYDLANTDGNKKYKLDVSGDNPRVTGPWPGDYWYFSSNASAKAGDVVTISFETRTSATGHKFWRLEYKDGEEWKVAGTPLTTNEPGETITYTHAMNMDGSTNVFVNTTVTYQNNTTIHEFRFVCAANWQANGKGALKVRNGGSARLSVTDANDSDKQPKIQSGDGSRVLFEDDFRWMTPLIKEYNKTASKPIGKSVEDNDPGAEAPNGYGAAVSIITGFYEKGYVDIHPEWKVMYPQDAYWKMGKTCDKKVETNGKYNVTGIVLPDFLAKNKASKVKVAFNWACHRRVLNEGKENETKETDPVKIVVEVIKNLNYATDASKAATYDVVSTSSAFETLQPVDKMEWQTASVVLEGISEGDRILIRPENMKPAKSTVNRWYIDNIKVTEAK